MKNRLGEASENRVNLLSKSVCIEIRAIAPLKNAVLATEVLGDRPQCRRLSKPWLAQYHQRIGLGRSDRCQQVARPRSGDGRCDGDGGVEESIGIDGRRQLVVGYSSDPANAVNLKFEHRLHDRAWTSCLAAGLRLQVVAAYVVDRGVQGLLQRSRRGGSVTAPRALMPFAAQRRLVAGTRIRVRQIVLRPVRKGVPRVMRPCARRVVHMAGFTSHRLSASRQRTFILPVQYITAPGTT